MVFRPLGRSGLKISPICLGTMMFGGRTDEATSSRIVAKAREAGINFLDSADAYNGGKSEQVVGRAISNNRLHWILATKLANQIGDDPNRGGLSRRWVLQACEESLKRLGTDFIDIYYLHKEDHSTPLEETVRAMGELIRQGKARPTLRRRHGRRTGSGRIGAQPGRWPRRDCRRSACAACCPLAPPAPPSLPRPGRSPGRPAGRARTSAGSGLQCEGVFQNGA